MRMEMKHNGTQEGVIRPMGVAGQLPTHICVHNYLPKSARNATQIGALYERGAEWCRTAMRMIIKHN